MASLVRRVMTNCKLQTPLSHRGSNLSLSAILSITQQLNEFSVSPLDRSAALTKRFRSLFANRECRMRR